jgi:hypothetical protein
MVDGTSALGDAGLVAATSGIVEVAAEFVEDPEHDAHDIPTTRAQGITHNPARRTGDIAALPAEAVEHLVL